MGRPYGRAKSTSTLASTLQTLFRNVIVKMASILLIAVLVSRSDIEFINGFHDTANAIATGVYQGTASTHSNYHRRYRELYQHV